MQGQTEPLEKVFRSLLVISALLLSAIMVVAIINLGQSPDSDASIESISRQEKTGEVVPRPEVEPTVAAATPTAFLEKEEPLTTEEILETTTVPRNDLYQLAEKYLGVVDVGAISTDPANLYLTGEARDFWILNVNRNTYRNSRATLVYQTPHVYFWVEDGVRYALADIERLVNTFEDQIYPRNHTLFGMEFSPGVDNDPHLSILYADDLGSAAGYFSSADSYDSAVEKFSNQSEMFYLSAEHVNLSSEYVYGVMAHEFQHMIHWYADRDESAWINEGLSELAVDLNGFDLGGFSYLFAVNPDLQLNFWPGSGQGSSTPHYGASFLFIKYLHQLYGDEFIKDLVTEQQNGFAGIEAVMRSQGFAVDNENFPAEALFQRWSIDNFIHTRQDIPRGSEYQWAVIGLPIEPTQTITCRSEAVSEQVKQFASDYIAVDCPGDFEIELEWTASVPVLPADPHSGVRYFWSNRGDESAMRLSRSFDLTEVEGPVTLSFWTWFDIEPDYDYLYVNASEDGQNWENLRTTHCTQEDPTGANYGCGYNGKSNGWVREEIDLARYAGKEITIEFEYVTDAAVNGEGLVLDDVAIDAIGYSEDFEEDAAGWKADGFVLIENTLPQRIGIAVVRDSAIDDHLVQILEFPANITFPISDVAADEEVVIVINGMTQYTHLPASYTLRINPLP